MFVFLRSPAALLGLIGTIAAIVLASTTVSRAQTSATPAPKNSAAAPSPAPNPFTWSGDVRGYYYTRQNASNYPGVQFDYAPGAKYNSNAVNQATFEAGINLHADYRFPDMAGWFVGAGYFYGNPFSGQCVSATLHAVGGVCITQRPPNLNPDDSIPGFTMSTFDETYLGFSQGGFTGKVGNMLIDTPWAGSNDGSRVKPAAFQGYDLKYAPTSGSLTGFAFEVANMFLYENRTSSRFSQQSLLTSYPAGGSGGLPSDIYAPGGQGINTNGFLMAKVGYTSQPSYTAGTWTADGYWYDVADLYNQYWGDAQYTWSKVKLQPYVALQGGWEANQGASYIGKIKSSTIGAQIGATPYKGKYGSLQTIFGFDSTPWHVDTYSTASLAAYGTCSTKTNTWSTNPGKTFAYFLPLNAADCSVNGPNTSIYYGGVAGAYTDGETSDPLFTSGLAQSDVDRRAPGNSYKIAGRYASPNNRVLFAATMAWYQYGNAITQTLPQFAPFASLQTTEWNLDARYYFSKNTPNQPYHGFFLRYRFIQRTIPDTYFASGEPWLGSIPLFKYSHAQVEYDF